MNKQQPRLIVTTLKHYHNPDIKTYFIYWLYAFLLDIRGFNQKMGMSLGHESKSRTSHKRFSVSLLNNKGVHFDSASADDFLFYLQTEL